MAAPVLAAVQQFVETYIIPTQLVLTMIGMGATLTVRDFIHVVKDAKGLLVGLTLQLVFVPLLTVAFIEVFGLTRGWAVGLVLIAVIPGGAFSNLLTYLGRGNAALSVSVTTVSNIGCIATIPVLLHLLVSEHVPPDFEVPTAHIIRDICVYLLLPLSAGMVVLRADPDTAVTVARWAVRAAVALLFVIIISSLASGRIEVHEYGWTPPLLLILFGNLLWIVTSLVCRMLRRYDDDNVALTMEVSVRNVAVALLLVQFFFEGKPAQEHVLYSCLFYGGMQFFIGVPVLLLHRHGHSPAFLWPPRPRPQVLKDS